MESLGAHQFIWAHPRAFVGPTYPRRTRLVCSTAPLAGSVPIYARDGIRNAIGAFRVFANLPSFKPGHGSRYGFGPMAESFCKSRRQSESCGETAAWSERRNAIEQRAYSQLGRNGGIRLWHADDFLLGPYIVPSGIPGEPALGLVGRHRHRAKPVRRRAGAARHFHRPALRQPQACDRSPLVAGRSGFRHPEAGAAC